MLTVCKLFLSPITVTEREKSIDFEVLTDVKILFPSSGTVLQTAVHVFVNGMATAASNLMNA